MHTASFFGRAEVARLLLDAGADPEARNASGEKPMDSMRHNKQVTEFIARLLHVTIDFEQVSAGRELIRAMLDEALGEQSSGGVEPESSGLGATVTFLTYYPLFQHLWFLWHLCWMVLALLVAWPLARALGLSRVPSVLIGTPLSLLWLVPLTMWTQSMQSGFGPDTSAGLIPMPQVLAHYSVFFLYGAALYAVKTGVGSVGRLWPMSIALAGVAYAYSGGGAAEGVVQLAAQATFVWASSFGLIGLFGWALGTERPWVRYVSDSSYWLYLAHLPLVIALQASVRAVDAPAWAKFVVVSTLTTLVLLISYRYLVRYSPIGTLLNGPRKFRA